MDTTFMYVQGAKRKRELKRERKWSMPVMQKKVGRSKTKESPKKNLNDACESWKQIERAGME